MEENFNDYVCKKFPTDSRLGTSGIIHIEFVKKSKQADCHSLFQNRSNYKVYVLIGLPVLKWAKKLIGP